VAAARHQASSVASESGHAGYGLIDCPPAKVTNQTVFQAQKSARHAKNDEVLPRLWLVQQIGMVYLVEGRRSWHQNSCAPMLLDSTGRLQLQRHQNIVTIIPAGQPFGTLHPQRP
jgi:hypothetical protein